MTQFIGVFDNALSEELCNKLINGHKTSKKVVKGRVGNGVITQLKDSHDVSMTHDEWKLMQQELVNASYPHVKNYLTEHYMALISALNPTVTDPTTGAPTSVTKENFDSLGVAYIDQLIQYVFCYDNFTVQHYEKGVGGYHYWHSEIYPQLPHNKPLHRVLAFLYYLNDVEEGGETEFHYQGIKVKPKQGSLIIFPAGFTHSHKGHIPISHEKYVISSWLMYNKAEQLYGSNK
jgi:hypothetical protein